MRVMRPVREGGGGGRHRVSERAVQRIVLPIPNDTFTLLVDLVNVALLVKDTTPGSQERSTDATGMARMPTPGRTA